MSDVALPASESRLRRLLRKGPTALLRSASWHARNLQRVGRDKLRFGLRTWSPTGFVPAYRAYYPDSLPSFPDLSGLYSRWVRGNKLNNNGDAPRFMALLLNLRQLECDGIRGDCAELGVWKGNSAAVLADFAATSKRRLFLFDTFSGFDDRDLVGADQGHARSFSDTSLDYVKTTVGHPEITTYLKGFFPDTITDEVRAATYALVHIDCDLYAPMKAALAFFYPRMPRGGMLLVHDYSSGTWEGGTQAVKEFCAETGEFLSLWPDKSGTAMIRKSRD